MFILILNSKTNKTNFSFTFAALVVIDIVAATATSVGDKLGVISSLNWRFNKGITKVFFIYKIFV